VERGERRERIAPSRTGVESPWHRWIALATDPRKRSACGARVALSEGLAWCGPKQQASLGDGFDNELASPHGYYAKGWVSFAQGCRLAGLDHYAFGVELGERDIPRQYGLTEAQEDLAHARRQ
jgi:hypothetical protein